MDVIRLDDLKEWRARRIQSGACSFDDMTALGGFIAEVEKMEIKEGKWKRYYNNLICSECGNMSICYIGRRSYEYCPRCGARMEGVSADIDCFDTCKHAYSEVCDECYKGNKYNAVKGADDETN